MAANRLFKSTDRGDSWTASSPGLTKGVNRDTIVTITKVLGGNIVGQGGRKTKKPVIYMKGTEKGFAVNSTNGKAIATMYGPAIENWLGKRISLYKSTTRNPNGDGEVDCIRVRPQVPPAKTGTTEEKVGAEVTQ